MFSDLENWGKGKNSGFESYVYSSETKKCIFDIGAHVGLTTLPVSFLANKDAKIYAFEPSIQNNRALKENIRLNNITNVVVENYLVGSNNCDEVDFYESPQISASNSIFNSINKENYLQGYDKDLVSKLRIKKKKFQVSIDSYCKDYNLQPDLIKIDVEGGEFQVLKGGIDTILAYKPLIYLSLHPEQLKDFGVTPKDLLSLIKSLNYEIINIDGSKFMNFKNSEYILRKKADL